MRSSTNNIFTFSDCHFPPIFLVLCRKSCPGRMNQSKLQYTIVKAYFIQEYERAVIFRLGRLLTGGARGPGVFFVIPCVDIYEKIDMRTNTYEIPPQEVIT